jgi:hypothetical protein
VLGQTVQNLSPDLSAEPWCDWLPAEYVRPARHALERDYLVRKPIVDVESNCYGTSLVKSAYTADAVRLEGWWFLLGGGAGVIHLNGEYRRGQEEGGALTREHIAPQRRRLREFVEGLHLAGLARFEGVAGLSTGALGSALAEPGRQYAVYLFHAREEEEWGLRRVPGAKRRRPRREAGAGLSGLIALRTSSRAASRSGSFRCPSRRPVWGREAPTRPAPASPSACA